MLAREGKPVPKYLFFLFAIFGFFSATPVKSDAFGAYRDIVPADNHDIEKYIRDTRRFQRLSKACAGEQCPYLECGDAERLKTHLVDTRFALRNQAYWWKKIAQDLYGPLATSIGVSIDDERLLARQQHLIAVQRFLADLGAALADISSISGTAAEWRDDAKLLDQVDRKVVAEKFDEIYELAKDYQSLQSTLRQRLGLAADTRHTLLNLPDFLGFEGGDLDTAKSHASDIHSIFTALQKVQEKGGALREALRSTGASTTIGRSLGQIIARFLGEIASARVEAAEASVIALQNSIEDSEGLQGVIYDAYQPLALRRDLFVDAFEAYEGLIQFGDGDRGGFSSCLQRTCPSINLNAGLLNEIDRRYLGDPKTMTDGGGDWREAIAFWDKILAALWDQRPQLPAITTTAPSLSVSKAAATPGDAVQINARAPICPAQKYSLKVTNPYSRVISDYPFADDSLTTQWRAPDVLGEYAVELERNGTVVARQAVHVSDARRLVGVWRYEYEDREVGMVSGKLAIMPNLAVWVEIGDGGRHGSRIELTGNKVTGSAMPDSTHVELELSEDGSILSGRWTDVQKKNCCQDRHGKFLKWRNENKTSEGDWFYATGKETWTKLDRKIDSVEVVSPKPDRDYGQLVNQCRYAYANANQPGFALKIYTENLPYWQWNWDNSALNVSFPHEPEFQIHKVDAEKLADGREVLIISGWLRCYHNQPQTFRMVPGKKVLNLDGQLIEFDLVFANYDGPPKVSQLQFVTGADAGFLPITTPVAHGRIVVLQVEFEAVPDKTEWPVSINVRGNSDGEQMINVTQTASGSKIYRSAPILIKGE